MVKQRILTLNYCWEKKTPSKIPGCIPSNRLDRWHLHSPIMNINGNPVSWFLFLRRLYHYHTAYPSTGPLLCSILTLSLLLVPVNIILDLARYLRAFPLAVSWWDLNMLIHFYVVFTITTLRIHPQDISFTPYVHHPKSLFLWEEKNKNIFIDLALFLRAVSLTVSWWNLRTFDTYHVFPLKWDYSPELPLLSPCLLPWN